MDPSEDIIDVLYRTRDRSSSPSQHTLSGHSSIAPSPPRNYEKELHDLRRQSLAHRGSHHLSDSVFHKQNFISPSRSFLPDQNRIRSYSGQHPNQSFNEGVTGPRQSIRCRPHKSENAVDVDRVLHDTLLTHILVTCHMFHTSMYVLFGIMNHEIFFLSDLLPMSKEP